MAFSTDTDPLAKSGSSILRDSNGNPKYWSIDSGENAVNVSSFRGRCRTCCSKADSLFMVVSHGRCRPWPGNCTIGCLLFHDGLHVSARPYLRYHPCPHPDYTAMSSLSQRSSFGVVSKLVILHRYANPLIFLYVILSN